MRNSAFLSILIPVFCASILLRGAENRMDSIVSPEEKPSILASGIRFGEGPVWIEDEQSLIFSDIPADQLNSFKDGRKEIFRKPSNGANGNILDLQRRLISCEHLSRSVTRTGKDGKVETLTDSYGGKKLNSPNDAAVRSDGTIWFTDPTYGLGNRKKELEKNYVFRLDPEKKELKAVAEDFDMPNGICFSPDEKNLYVADSGAPRHIRVFDVQADGTLANGKVFCRIDNGAPDGIRCDSKGRIFSSAGDGVHVFSPEGELIGKITVPETVTNLCFGGKDGKKLFMTGRNNLYSINLK